MDVIVSEHAPGPFAGMTVEHARTVNAALSGLLVDVWGGKFEDGPERYRLSRVVLPGERGWTMEAPGDLVLVHVREDGSPKHGICRVVSASLVKRFDVLTREPDYVCSSCGDIIPPNAKVHDVGGLGNHRFPNGDWEWEQRFECSACWYSEGW